MDESDNLTFKIPRSILFDWICKSNFTTEDLQILNISCPSDNPIETFRSNGSDKGNGNEFVNQLTTSGSVIFALGMILNIALLIILFVKRRHFKTSWYCVCSLIAADVLVLLNMLGFVLFIVHPPLNWLTQQWWTYLFPSTDMFVSSASMLSVAAIALDRLMSVLKKTYTKQRKLTVKWILIVIWSYSIIILLLGLGRIYISSNSFYKTFVFWLATAVVFISSITVTLFSYVMLGVLYLRHSYQLNKSFAQNTENVLLNSVNENKQRKRMWRSVTVTFSSLPFLIGWSFYLSVQTYEVLTGTYFKSISLNMAMFVIPSLVSALNPLAYVITSNSIRKIFREIFCNSASRRTDNDVSTATYTADIL